MLCLEIDCGISGLGARFGFVNRIWVVVCVQIGYSPVSDAFVYLSSLRFRKSKFEQWRGPGEIYEDF